MEILGLVASARKPAPISTVCLLIVGAGSLLLLRAFGPQQLPSHLAAITVDYPANGSVFPPEITPPTFLWRDTASGATSWHIDIAFPNGAPAIHVKASGERMHIGEIDPEAVSRNNEPPKLTPEQADAHTWTPDAETWAAIKKRSVESPAILAIAGFRSEDPKQPVSSGQVAIQTSRDAVGAPVFYRDVPLMPNQGAKGVIKPLAPESIGLIKWRLRYLDEPRSRVVMQKIETCANCHSFSADGKTLGLDVDGPANDHGLYALIPVASQTSIRTQDVIKWPTVRDPKVPRLRSAFMSQISPDGRYVVSTIDDPDAVKRATGRTLEDKYYVANFLNYRFLQVFYPTRGILGWYDRDTKDLQPLPGANDPRYVQTSGIWTRDGKYIVFARAEAKTPYQPGTPLALYANDPNEAQIQYDIYRIPFNEGRGGTPERVVGASANGMSNSFPKVSPDGRWIVFVQARNGMVMRPDGKLYIVPFAGGEARLMNCNTPLMNSWHTFSPNGRWLAFSSKGRSPYTQLYLTHIDANGNDTPPILVDNTTAANRAVNLPEFANIPRGGLETIDPVATKVYAMENEALELMKRSRYSEAVPEWRTALESDPADGEAHFNLGYSLRQTGDSSGALAEYRKACDLRPDDPVAFAHLALSLAQDGKPDEAIADYRRSLALNDANPAVEADLGMLLSEKGLTAEALEHLRKAVAMSPDAPDAQSKLAAVLVKAGQAAEATAHLEKAVALAPNTVEYRFNLAYALGRAGRFADAIPQLQKAVELSGGKDWQCYDMLGAVYSKMGRPEEAIQAERRALDLAVAGEPKNEELVRTLRAKLADYGK
ncbi:MAG TPA: tetratricopeptide repeat protein [Bryobacteraceae bacterium]|nr:tetratricopeptide repeat protein [Bryobacteraceae bacterium]